MKTFWEGKKVLITGHTGFKGSWLSLWLNKLGAQVIGYSLPPPTKPSLFEAANIKSGINSIIGDIRDLKHIKAVIAEHQPEIIFHMAAQSLVRYSYEHPSETYSTNIMGTANVLEAIRTSENVCVAIIVTSDKCYENNEWIWGYRENDPVGGYDPYSSSKGCAELITQAYRNSYFSGKNNNNRTAYIASVRAGNVIGGGDWAEDRLIPDIMKAFLKNRSPLIRSPNAIRPWQHVLEPLNGYLMLAERLWEFGPDFAEAWNFGPNIEDAKPVSWISDYLTRLWGYGVKCKFDSVQHPHESDHLHEARYLKLDCSKAMTLLGWSPKLSLNKALELTVDWYQMYKKEKDMRDITEKQILHYQDMP